ncbi:hypothetical protein J4410_05070 [Candidatus Woesearchaeota archaeon]|nr:hypothetical protein [Candidatus Woesearchaeota archaeon]
MKYKSLVSRVCARDGLFLVALATILIAYSVRETANATKIEQLQKAFAEEKAELNEVSAQAQDRLWREQDGFDVRNALRRMYGTLEEGLVYELPSHWRVSGEVAVVQKDGTLEVRRYLPIEIGRMQTEMEAASVKGEPVDKVTEAVHRRMMKADQLYSSPSIPNPKLPGR